MAIPFAGRGGYDWKQASVDAAVDTGTETPVQQQFKEEMDINTIVRRFGITAELPFGPAGGMYGDFTDIVDYDSAVALVKQTDAQFMSLPAEVRERFMNDPATLVRFAQAATPEEFEAAFRPPVAADAAPGAEAPV